MEIENSIQKPACFVFRSISNICVPLKLAGCLFLVVLHLISMSIEFGGSTGNFFLKVLGATGDGSSGSLAAATRFYTILQEKAYED